MSTYKNCHKYFLPKDYRSILEYVCYVTISASNLTKMLQIASHFSNICINFSPCHRALHHPSGTLPTLGPTNLKTLRCSAALYCKVRLTHQTLILVGMTAGLFHIQVLGAVSHTFPYLLYGFICQN